MLLTRIYGLGAMHAIALNVVAVAVVLTNYLEIVIVIVGRVVIVDASMLMIL